MTNSTTPTRRQVLIGLGTTGTVSLAGCTSRDDGSGGDIPTETMGGSTEMPSPTPSTAPLRLVHASPDAPAVDITAKGSGDTLFDGVPYGESGYVEVPAGEYTVQVRGDTESNDGDVVASFDLSIAGGEVYTGLAVGYLSPDDEPADTAFDLRVARDISSN